MVTASDGRLLDEALDLLVGAGHLLPALALDVEVQAALARPRLPVVLEVLALGGHLAASHFEDALQEVLGLHAVARLLREVVDFELERRNVILFVFFVHKLIPDLQDTLQPLLESDSGRLILPEYVDHGLLSDARCLVDGEPLLDGLVGGLAAVLHGHL